MSAGRLIVYLAAAVLLFFGVIFVLGAFSPNTSSQIGTLVVGLVLLAACFGLIWFGGRLGKKAAEETTIVQKIDLSGDVKLEQMTCRNCGGTLSSENITMLAGAPVVHCPYCGASYQLAEAPKW